MYCGKCGEFNDDENAFCINCRNELRKTDRPGDSAVAGSGSRYCNKD